MLCSVTRVFVTAICTLHFAIADVQCEMANNLPVRYFGNDIMLTSFDRMAQVSRNTKCVQQLKMHQKHVSNLTLWAIQMLDASSKFPSGVLGGATYHLGNFDECLAVNSGHAGAARVTGKYCLAKLELLSTEPLAACEGDDAQCSAWHKIQVSKNRLRLRRNVLRVGLCMPAACSAQDIAHGLSFLDTLLPTLSIQATVDESMCQVEGEAAAGWLPYIWVGIFAYFSFLVAFDYRRSDKMLVGAKSRWLEAFSVRSHWQVLTNQESSSDNSAICCIHGLRVFSMIVIVCGHRGEALTAGPLVNGNAVEDMYEDFLSILAMNGHLIVDVFFTMSGFLICWNLLRCYEQKKNVSLVWLYINRYLRLTPVLMVVIAFEALALYDLSSGPVWPEKVGRERDNCRVNWWTNLLHVNNYVRPESPCVDPSWYIACDTQLFAIAPLIVACLHKWRRGYLTLCAAIAGSVVIPFTITYMRDLDPTIISDPSTLGHTSGNGTYISVYVTAYCRAGPYFVGMAFAYWLNKMRSTNTKMSKVIVWFGWVLGPLVQLGMLSAAVLFYQTDPQLSKFSVALYAGVHRTLFSAGVGFAIAACASGQGGILGRILSWPRLRPFSRLAYSVFLSHTVIQMFHFGSTRTQMYISYTDIIWFSISDLVISVVVATVLYLTVERPATSLGRSLLAREKTNLPATPDHPLQVQESQSIIGKQLTSLLEDYHSVTPGELTQLARGDKKRS